MDALFAVPEELDQARRRQWRLSEVQLANWGTFDGAIYRIPIARKGHLFTGPSGSGKSSLLDAISAVLTPDQWLDFNAAAQGGGSTRRKRNRVSYVRGAWTQGTEDDEDKVVAKYLRPQATWSGVLLRFENELDETLTLGRVFFAKGTSTRREDVADLRIFNRGLIDLAELQPFLSRGLQTRKIQKNWPGATVTGSGKHYGFFKKMREAMDIPAENALQLLHKTQSTKNLDSLDRLFRNYMLDKPRTFDLVDTAVSQFEELHATYEHVTQLRLQRDSLERLRRFDTQYQAALTEVHHVEELADALLPFQERFDLTLTRRSMGAAREALGSLTVAHDRAVDELRLATAQLDAAKDRERDLGGANVRHLREHLESLGRTVEATAGRWERMRLNLSSVGIEQAPTTGEQFAQLQREITAMLETAQPVHPTHEQLSRLSDARQEVERIDAEIQSLNRNRSQIPSGLLRVRAALAKSLGVPLTVLPFAGELIGVKPEYSDWAGAIERVLRPFALTLLVRSEYLVKVRQLTDRMDTRERFVYEEVLVGSVPRRPAGSDISLVNRVEVVGGPLQDWVQSALSHRFDFACVDNPDDMADYPRALTRKGQAKTSTTRYVKDDRVAISERQAWVLGNREDKLEALITARQVAALELSEAEALVDGLQEQADRDRDQRTLLRTLAGLPWTELDVEGARKEMESVQVQLEELIRPGSDLEAAAREVVASREETVRCETEKNRLFSEMTEADRVLTSAEQRAQELQGRLDSGDIATVAPALEETLGKRFRAKRRDITSDNLYGVGSRVADDLRKQGNRALARQSEAAREITQTVTQFKTKWPQTAADLTTTVEDRGGYLEIYETIVAQGLPDHEARFLQLLRERSRDLVGELLSDIRSAPREIRERVGPINDSLLRSEFDDDRFLNIRVKQKWSPTVKQFADDLLHISSGTWDNQDLEKAEEKFRLLKKIMDKAGSSLPEDQRWKNECLDTRGHVTFLAEEIDKHGTVHATYDSAAAMSGGQQQKLVIFCLAAALRYQLTSFDAMYSRYGTVIMDEAFDRADVRFTRLALEVFKEFGFQLLLATPQKFISVIEPYVGGITSIENPTRQRTEVASLNWEEVAP